VRTPCVTGSPARRAERALLLVVATAALVLGGGSAALAHDEVSATAPAARASVPTPPAEVVLTMSSPPQGLGTEVQVTGPDGAVVSEGPAEVLDDTVTQPLADGLPAGAYTVDYRVTSGDGHPISGSFGFTVAQGAPSSSAAPSSAAPSSSAAAPAPEESSAAPESSPAVGEASASRPAESSSSTWLLVAGAAVVLAVAALVAWRLRRRA
jgi:methionine-rich copper-binding protein CopC